jgi:Cft2 family RNA processing exonuclease
LFHFDRGLKLTRPDLAVDVRRRQPRGFISHAHNDHMAPHQLALCTPATGKLYQFRLGNRPVHELPYRQAIDFGGLRLTAFPAGHCLGSAMLLAEDGEASLLYTGDFKLGESATAERAEVPRADVLVIESTYGDPRYRLIPRAIAVQRLYDVVADALAAGATPVIRAYTLGKSQEVTRLLTMAGFGVSQHRDVYAVSQVYERCGVDLGKYELYAGSPPEGHAVIVPPHVSRDAPVTGITRRVTIAVSGWAAVPESRRWLSADHGIPLSDHADYDELFECIERVAPREVYCTHGPASFVDCLRAAGIKAFPLAPPKAQKPAVQRTFL